MTERTAFERSLVAWMADDTAAGMPQRAVDELLTATSSVRPSRPWLARVREPAFRWRHERAAGTSRRALVLVTAAALLVLAMLAAVAAGWRPFQPPTTGDWNGYRAGAGRTGVGDAGPVGNPVLHWRVATGDSVKDAIAVVGDLVIAPSQDGVLHAFALDDGTERWRFAPGTSVTGPYVADGLVFITDGRGVVHGLEVATGLERWRSADLVDAATTATVGDGVLVIGTTAGELVALDSRDGTRRWRTTVATGAVHEPGFVDGVVYFAADDGTVAAVRARDGSPVWRLSVGSDPTGTPTVADGIVYVGARSDAPGGRLRALDAATGAVVWQTDEPWFAPTVADGLAVSGRTDGIIAARDARTGVERWRFASGGQTRGPAIAGQTVFFNVDLERWIGALDLKTGLPLWRYDIDDSNQCCIAVAKGFVVAGTMAGSVYVVGGDGSAISRASAGAFTLPPFTSTSPTSVPSSPRPAMKPPEPFAIVARRSSLDLGLDRPLGLAVAPSGDVYVTDLSMRVTRLNRDLDVVGRWGALGSGRGEFDFQPAAANANVHGSVAVGPDGTVYVSDSDNHRVQAFSADGQFIRPFGSLGSEPGEFTIPFDLGADAAGNVYVVDDGLRRLTKFGPDGIPVWVIDGSTDPRLDGHLHSAKLDAAGRIHVVNDDTGVVLTIGADGSVLDSFPAPGCDVAPDDGGRLYVTDCFGGVTVYGPDHDVIAQTSGSDVTAPQFGPDGEIVALTRSGDVVRLRSLLPAAPSASALPSPSQR